MRAIGVWRALERARELGLAAAGLPPPRPAAGGVTRRALLRALAAAPAVAAIPAPAAIRKGERVAILGGGIAGLSALHHLVTAGIDARLYEARPRLGGRMHTLREDGRPTVERGGQLVNTDHSDIRTLAGLFGIDLIDRKAAPHRTIVLDGARMVPETDLARALTGIAGQIDADSALLDRDYRRHAPAFDRLSIAAYLDRHAALVPDAWARRLLESIARTEYGVEPDQASALELLFAMPTVKGERVEILGGSDERWVIDGGSGALIDAMGNAYAARIARQKEAIRIVASGTRLKVIFLDLSAVEADRVIVAVPASIARRIEYAVPIAPDWRAFLDVMTLGRNEKRQVRTTGRPWQPTLGSGGELWPTDPAGPALGWDGELIFTSGAAWTVWA